MAERLTARVTIRLGGRDWRLVVTYGVLQDCEEATGIDMLNTVEVFVSPSTKTLRALVWAVLRREEPGLTLEQAGGFLTSRNLPQVRASIAKAFLASLPEPEKRKPKKDADAKPSPMGWLETWAAARVELRLIDDELLTITPRMFHELREVAVKQLRHQELIVGGVIAAVKNHSARPLKKWAKAKDFILHRLPIDGPDTTRGAVIDRETGGIRFGF